MYNRPKAGVQDYPHRYARYVPLLTMGRARLLREVAHEENAQSGARECSTSVTLLRIASVFLACFARPKDRDTTNHRRGVPPFKLRDFGRSYP